MLPRFKCWVPKSKSEALSLLSELDGPRVLAGGTDLLVELQRGKKAPHLVDITRVAGLSWTFGERGSWISPLATHSTLANEPRVKELFPCLSLACSHVGSPQIRNMGTIGGNIANASPAADGIPPLLLYDAELLLESETESRQIPLEEAIVGAYKTSLLPQELISGILVRPLKGFRQGYKRLSVRDGLAMSRLSVAYAIKETRERWVDIRISIGSMTPVCFRAREFEAMLQGEQKDRELLEHAIDQLISRIKERVGDRPTHRFKVPILRNVILDVFGVGHGSG